METRAALLCRDCLARFAAAPGPRPRCRACGSPRVFGHAELDSLAIAHIDCDAFFAAIEKRDNPELADKPVIIGGGKRGVVSTACYIARTYGVRSAMPMFKALEACPDAVVIKPDIEKYSRIGRQIRSMMLDLTPAVEPVSIDEAFLDLSGTERLHGSAPAETLMRFARHVESELDLSVSMGLSYNKFLAKIASDLDKPRGFAVIGQAEVVPFLAGRPIGIIPGVGKVTQERLARDGLRLIADVQRLSDSDLARRYGEEGLRLARLARGEDRRPVKPERETKSISAETTFDEDIADPQRLAPILLRLSEKLALRLRKSGFSARGLTLKMKTSDFRTRTRARSGFPPTQLASRIFDIGREMLVRECDGARFRLIGIGASDLGPAEEADRGDLVDVTAPRDAGVERAIDRLREKFGGDAVMRGLVFGARAEREKH
ncbi:DNA polymerase IV [Alsobacter soli]|uniref:DNA polymerase IV n=1 Tax=Alsobacter soli TaxID=2109933 RepID=A0A2T1HN07_9HYPH|nr:DNA polymerase IV [Alsobacter soli]PSC03026.1 DNA polymerase IV [Alsobacter soli]